MANGNGPFVIPNNSTLPRLSHESRCASGRLGLAETGGLTVGETTDENREERGGAEARR